MNATTLTKMTLQSATVWACWTVLVLGATIGGFFAVAMHASAM